MATLELSMPETKRWVLVPVRMSPVLRDRLREAAGLGGDMAPIVRAAVEQYLSSPAAQRQNVVSVNGLERADIRRVERFAAMLRKAPDEVKDLIDQGLTIIERVLRGK